MNSYIGIDLGTSSVKILLVGADGKIIKSVSRDYPICYPRSGWSEQNPQDWWNAVCETIREVCPDPETAQQVAAMAAAMAIRWSLTESTVPPVKPVPQITS